MLFTETKLKGAFVIEMERLTDERGFFARSFCREEFRAHGLTPRVEQCSISFNAKAGTLRGLHYQESPHGETKLVRVTRGSIFDVILDLRPESATYLQWTSSELSAENGRMLYIPHGFAHGFLTLSGNTEVFYQMAETYQPESARGLRWNDPAFAIAWPLTEGLTMSERDASYPDFSVVA